MKPKKIRLFVKPYCGWCHDAADWLKDRGMEYETLDVMADPSARQEMIQLSGQGYAPVIEIDGKILANFDTEQLAAFWETLERAQSQK